MARSRSLRAAAHGDGAVPWLRVQGVPIVSIVVPFFGLNQVYIKDPKNEPKKGTTMETIGRS